MEWVVETAASNYEIGSTVECKWATGGVGAESFTMDWRMMNNGTLSVPPAMQLSSDGTLTTAKSLIATTGAIQALSATSGNIAAAGPTSKIAGIFTQPGPAAGSEILFQGGCGAQLILDGAAYGIGSGVGADALDARDPANTGFTINYIPLVATTVSIAGPGVDGVIVGGGTSAVGFTVPAFEPFSMSILGAFTQPTTGLLGAVIVYGNASPI